GETYRLMGRFEEALTDLNHAIQLEPDYAWAIASRGETYRLMGRFEEALTDLNHAIQLEPDYAWAIANRGETYRLMHRYDDALTDLNHAIQLEPDYAWAIANRGQTYRLMSRYDEALTDLNHAIQLDPEDGWAIYESAVVLRLSGSEGAAERWHRVVEVFQAESVGEGRKAVWAAGNLLVVLCGLPDWQRAQEQVDVFLSGCTSCHQIKEVLNDLADLRGALSVDASQLDPIVSRLEAALSQS
ncbi:tetratricopeptide repeat protein, partial [Streptomyces griseofuscus]|uniref:tetratricopeptide repeat protein n=1 Tax=Streptomyces griseofuscus TaxID=146922 RepID=UPI00380D25B1